jgi:serpin B
MIVAAMALASCSGETVETQEPEAPEDQVNVQEPTVDSAFVLTKEIESRAIEQANQFSYSLFDVIYDDINNLDDKNIFVSPLSVSMELSMLANGTAGETRDEIIKALGYDGVASIDGVNQINANLLETLPEVDPRVKFTIANALWVNSRYQIKNEFGDLLNQTYNAEVDNLDFTDGNSVNIINDWAKSNTNGLIDEIINSIDPLSKIILANALYFKADWTSQDFITSNKFNFTSYDGKTTKVESMSKADKIDYNSSDKCQIATFDFGQGNYTYTAILPNADVSLKDAVNSVNDELLNGVSKQYVSFEAPMFKFDNEIDLSGYMPKLGITRIFDETKADFSNLTDDKMSVALWHNTSINLNDGGAEAAAVSYMIDPGCNDDSPVIKYIKMELNRPFAFIIREKTTNAIIFIGAINKL